MSDPSLGKHPCSGKACQAFPSTAVAFPAYHDVITRLALRSHRQSMSPLVEAARPGVWHVMPLFSVKRGSGVSRIILYVDGDCLTNL
jgi:hypothetical protein